MAEREKVAEELLAIKAYFAGQAIEAKEEIIKEVFVEAQQTIENAISMLKEQEAVVRCKDCKHRDPEDGKCDSGHGIQWQLPRQDDWFCADAEPKDS